MKIIAVFILLVIAIFIYQIYADKKRREYLLKKYKDHQIVDRIMRKEHWQGQTEEQLLDSLGKPIEIDERVMKTKTTETWKYNQQGKNRFGLRVTVENGLVIGWDQKS